MLVDEEDNGARLTMQRLRWACRRGMLELDLLLINFLERGYADLNEVLKQQFALLLTCPDPEIFEWLMGYSQPVDTGMLAITEAIRRHAKVRF